MSDGNVRLFGETSAEQQKKDDIKCHQIVKTIIDYGVSERQKLRIAYLLSLELVDRSAMQAITTVIKDCEEKDAKTTLITDI